MLAPRQNNGSLIGGAILIALGLVFLLGQFVSFSAWQYLWPLFLVALGGIFFAGMVAGGKSMAPMAIPGSILTTIGLLMVFQNFTGRWESWAYGWTVIIVAVGIGIYIMGAWTGNPQQRQAGVRLAGIGLVLAVVFGGFFELLIFGGDSPWRPYALPVLLILLGLFILVRRTNLWPAQWRPTDTPSESVDQTKL